MTATAASSNVLARTSVYPRALRKSPRQRSIPGSVRTTRASAFFVTSAFIGCRVQIVRKGAKDLGDARPLGTKLLALPGEWLVRPLQRGHQGLELVLLFGRLREPFY